MSVLLLRMGLLLGFGAVFLQIAVFLQPLLPKQYQIAPVCETISQVLLQSNYYQQQTSQHDHSSNEDHHQLTMQSIGHQTTLMLSVSEHSGHEVVKNSGHDHHDPSHQCQYCTVYGNLVLPPVLEIKEVLDRVQVRLIAFQQAYRHVWFALQRLFLIPQGRAPPLFA